MNSSGHHRVIIIGASFAGRMCAQHLLDHFKDDRESIEILLIDKSSHFEFICTNYKSLCDDDAFEYLTVSNKNAVDILNFDPNSTAGDTDNQYKPI